jgi:hemin uptake protein HemP
VLNLTKAIASSFSCIYNENYYQKEISRMKALPPESKPVTTVPPVLTSNQLFKGASVVEITHAGQRYLLRVTRENKLILTK